MRRSSWMALGQGNRTVKSRRCQSNIAIFAITMTQQEIDRYIPSFQRDTARCTLASRDGGGRLDPCDLADDNRVASSRLSQANDPRAPNLYKIPLHQRTRIEKIVAHTFGHVVQ